MIGPRTDGRGRQGRRTGKGLIKRELLALNHSPSPSIDIDHMALEVVSRREETHTQIISKSSKTALKSDSKQKIPRESAQRGGDDFLVTTRATIVAPQGIPFSPNCADNVRTVESAKRGREMSVSVLLFVTG